MIGDGYTLSKEFREFFMIMNALGQICALLGGISYVVATRTPTPADSINPGALLAGILIGLGFLAAGLGLVSVFIERERVTSSVTRDEILRHEIRYPGRDL
jgi:hypothetical protein